MTEPSATASVEVAVNPTTAFEVFTAEIDQWWLRNPISFFDSGRVTAMRIEPGVGGRVLEVYADDVLELATITDWEPGTRLGYRSSVDDTETRVDFEPVDGGTRVTVVQSLITEDGTAFYFWPRVIRWLPDWVARRATAAGKSPREIDRLSIALYYEDPAAAARWLHEAFAINSWDTLPAEGETPMWIELHVGSVAVLLFKRTDARPTAVDHNIWVYVDDLDAHFAHAQSAGAKILSEIHSHGYRCYEAQDLEGHPWTFAQARPTMP